MTQQKIDISNSKILLKCYPPFKSIYFESVMGQDGGKERQKGKVREIERGRDIFHLPSAGSHH